MITSPARRRIRRAAAAAAALAMGLSMSAVATVPAQAAGAIQSIPFEAVNESHVVLGELASRSQRDPIAISGIGPYTIRGTDSRSGEPYSYLTDFNYDPGDPGDGPGWSRESDERALSNAGTWTGENTDFAGVPAGGPYVVAPRDDVLRLSSSTNCRSGNTFDGATTYCSVFGPDVYTETFEASDGQAVSFDWAATGASDDYEIYAFLVKVDDVNDYGSADDHILLAHGRGDRQDWTTTSAPVPGDGTYRFRFVNGSYDGTGGYAVGAVMYVDSVVRVGTANPIDFPAIGDQVLEESGATTLELSASAAATDGGPVTFRSTTPSVCTVSGDQATLLGDGICTIVADHPGDEVDYVPAQSVARSFRVLEAPEEPINSGDPTIEGDLEDGETVTVDEGTWTDGGSPVTDTSYQWEVSHDDGDTTSDVPGATSEECLLAESPGSQVRVVVTKTNGIGSTSASSEWLEGFTCAVAPDAPTGLDATPADGGAELDWSAPADDGGADITGYLVEKSLDDGETWTVVTTTTGSGTSYTVDGLANGTPVGFRVSTVTPAGTSEPSATAEATPRTVAGAPTGLTATPQDGSAELDWSAPADDGGAEITGYLVEKSLDDGETWTTAEETGPTSTSCTVEPLDNGTEVAFRVSTVNAAGTGAASATATATPRTVPDAPTDLVSDPQDGQVSLSWAAPAWNGGAGVTGYRIEVSLDGEEWTVAFADAGAGTSETVSGLDNGTPYRFRVSALNAAGAGEPSAEAPATPRTVPDAPTGLALDPQDGRAVLTWTEPWNGGAAISGYVVEVSTDGVEWEEALVEGPAGAEATATVTGLDNGTPYRFRVSAVNVAGTGDPSDSAQTTPRTVADAPTGLAATPGDRRVDLTWDAPAEDGGAEITGYRVEKSTDGGLSWVEVAADTGSANPWYTVESLANGTEAAFRVSAVNAAGTGDASAPAASTPRTVAGELEIVSVTESNRTLTIEFTTPEDDGGSAITGYEYSLDGGATWIPFDGGTSPLVIGGLENGAEYGLTLRAVNAAGAGPSSTVTTTSPKLVPVTVPRTEGGAPALPSVEPGASELWVDGTPVPVTVTEEDGVWTIEGDGFAIEITPLDGGDEILTVDEQGRLVISHDGSVQVAGSGFKPGTTADVWLFSTPVLLGEPEVDGSGRFQGVYELPDDTPAGPHTLQVNGLSVDGELRTLATGIVVLAAPALALSGAQAWPAAALAAALLLLGAGGLVIARRRRLARREA